MATKVGLYCTSKLSEALILASINQLYDNRLFIELQEKCMFRTCCVNTQIVFFCFCFDIQGMSLGFSWISFWQHQTVLDDTSKCCRNAKSRPPFQLEHSEAINLIFFGAAIS